MKRIIMLCLAAMTVVSAASAQSRINIEATKRKVASADADIANPKKNTKAATWISHGNAYYDAAVAPVAGVYKGMSEAEVQLIIGKPASERTENVQGEAYKVLSYPTMDLYIPADADYVLFWKPTVTVAENALDVAFNSYKKAVEIDSKQDSKVKPLALKIVNEYKQLADVSFTSGDFKGAAQAFGRAYDISADPIVNQPDSMSAYNAGYVGVLAEDYDYALDYLKKAQALGYDMEGEIYFLLYHAYNGKGDETSAESVLKEGIQRYPANSRLIEAMIMFYTTTGQDASQIIPMIEEALAKDPTNYVFHFGLGMIYEKLNDFEKAASEFQKAGELNPGDFNAYFNEALTYIRHAESLLPELNDIPLNEQARYDEKLNQINDLYKKAIDPLLEGHRLNPTYNTNVELLKNIYFRFRDDSPEMMQNYEKYNELLKELDD